MKKYLFLTFLVFLVLFVSYVMSPLSNVKEIVVEGNNLISSEAIKKATRVNIGDGFWQINVKDIKYNIELLTLVEEVTVDYQFPHTVQIYVVEKNIVAYSEQKDSSYKMLLSDGMEITFEGQELFNRPIISNTISGQLLYKIAIQLSEVDLVALVNLSEITKDIDDDEVVVVFTRDGYELRMLFDRIGHNLQLYSSIVEELRSVEDNNGIINMFEAYWFEAYRD